MSALALIASLATPIIGGTPTTTSDYPAVVVVDVGDVLCTGEIVAPQWVMTAAHCLDPAELDLPAQADVTARTLVAQGTVNYPTDLGTTTHADATYLDPMWNHEHFGQHDMALVHFATPLVATPLVANFKASLAPVGIVVTMVGYGTTTANPGATGGVEYQLAAQTSVTCGDFSVGSNASLNDGELLCFSQSAGVGRFRRLRRSAARDDRGRETIVGITSFGDQACDVFGAYTRTNAEVDFINAMIPALCDDDACVDPPTTTGGCDSGAGSGGALVALALALSVGARTPAARRARRARAGRPAPCRAGG